MTIEIIPGHTYGIDTGDGNAITAGLQAHEARATAQRIADERGETVYLYDADVASGRADDPDYEAIGPSDDDDDDDDEPAPGTVDMIRHGSFGPIIWLTDGSTRAATQRDMDTLPVGPDLTEDEESEIEE